MRSHILVYWWFRSLSRYVAVDRYLDFSLLRDSLCVLSSSECIYVYRALWVNTLQANDMTSQLGQQRAPDRLDRGFLVLTLTASHCTSL